MRGRTQKFKTTSGECAQGTPDRLGKYEIIEPIGEGGFGIVYKGFDPHIKRYVAIKTCTSPDKDLRQRYFREAEIAGRLDHPNIVRIFDFGTQNETPYLVQEFLAGCDLDHKMAGSEFVPYPERLLYLIQIARGLSYAHDQGVIHRDIKPANIRILEDGSTKIMDFGVAILLNTETRLTKDGMAVGTAAYLAPEQVQGKSTDRQTDVFSFGVLAYELLTGQRPFEKDSISATLYSVLNDDPKPITLPRRVCPPALRQLVERCLEKTPERRTGDFPEVLEELDRIRTEMRPTGRQRDFTSELRNVNRMPDDRPDSSQTFDPPLDHVSPPASIRMQRRRRRWGLSIPAAAVAILATAYGLLAAQGLIPWPGGLDGSPDPASTTSTPRGVNSTLPPTLELEPPVADPALSATGTRTSEGIDNALSDAGEETAAELETVAEEPVEVPPPPEVEKARIYLMQGWHDAITVRINGGEPIRLSRTRSRELEPGNYTIRYSLVTGDYNASQIVRVELKPGQEKTLHNPIGRPGQLSVQASLGSPQGLVQVNGEPVGQSPLRSLSMAPGRHRLQVFAVNHPSTPLADTTVEVKSSSETVVTFDLTGQRELAVRYRNPSS